MLNLNFKSYGEAGPYIIIVHGLFGMLDNWHSFSKKLSKHGFQVLSIDQRDHGRSPKTDAFNYKLLSQDLADFFLQHKIENAHLVGHSLGGKSVMQFSLQFPHHVKSQTIIDIGPKKYAPRHQAVFDALTSLDLTKIKSRKDATELLSTKLKEESVIQFLLKNLDRKVDTGYQWKMNLDLLINSYDAISSQVGTEEDFSYLPTLFVRGAKSSYILDEDMEYIASIFANAELETLDTGHWIHAEKPDALLEVIIDFID